MENVTTQTSVVFFEIDNARLLVTVMADDRSVLLKKANRRVDNPSLARRAQRRRSENQQVGLGGQRTKTPRDHVSDTRTIKDIEVGRPFGDGNWTSCLTCMDSMVWRRA